jgi:hypothetical protein
MTGRMAIRCVDSDRKCRHSFPEYHYNYRDAESVHRTNGPTPRAASCTSLRIFA